MTPLYITDEQRADIVDEAVLLEVMDELVAAINDLQTAVKNLQGS